MSAKPLITTLTAVALAMTPVTAAVTLSLTPTAAEAKDGNGNNGNNGKSEERGNKGGNGNANRSANASTGNGNGNRGGNGNGKGLLRALGLVPQTDTQSQTSVASTAPSTGNSNSWKTRIDGEITVHPSELGPWNSARRSPQAIANMVAKYEETGEVNGAGGMVGMFVSAYSGYNSALAGDPLAEPPIPSFNDLIQMEIDEGRLDYDAVTAALASGEFPTEEGLLTRVDDLSGYDLPEGVVLSYVDGMVSCEDGGSGGCGDVESEDAYADLRAEIESIEGDATLLSNEALSARLEEIEGAESLLGDAQAMVVPHKTPELQEDMLRYIEDLLDVEVDTVDAGDLTPPVEPVEPIVEGEIVEG